MRKILPIFLLLFSTQLLAKTAIMPLSEIKPGMKGYGVTVVRGKKKIRFDVEIIDVMKKISPKRDLILARFSGKIINKTGIAQGMSGSPIYINGKLIGALAYTWGYLKESIGGIQPIEQMLPVWKNKKNHKREPIKFITFDHKLAKKLNLPSANKIRLPKNIRHIGTPLMISGFSGPVFNFFKEKFEKLGFNVLQGAGGSSKVKNNSSGLTPGDAVGIPLVTGDANMAAIGTVTYRDKNKVLIFGHPFMNRGDINLPMSQAIVHYVLPSMVVSWKFASSTKIVGTVTNDRETAVAGKLGPSPKMLPVQLNLNREEKQETFQYKMTPDPFFFPNIFAGIIMSSVFSRDYKMAEGSVDLNFKLKVMVDGKEKTIEINDFFIGKNKDALYQAVFRMISPIQYLTYNWFKKVSLKRIEVNVKKVPFYQVAALEKAVLLSRDIKPGSTVKVRLFLRLYKGGYIDKIIRFRVPGNINAKKVYLNISSARIEHITDKYLYSPKFAPKSIEQLLKMLQANLNFSDIAVWMDVPQNSAVVNGHFLPNLPISKLANYAFRETGNYFMRSRRNLKYLKTNYLIAGYLKLTIPIKSK